MKNSLLLFLLLAFTSFSIFGQSKPVFQEKWLDNKFSMFIHFGIYSHLGGIWDGQKIARGYSEQIQSHAGIYNDVYAEVANEFMPDKWNADSVVALAKKAGMRSVVITSKHHDGFCLFRTKTTDYNMVDATPFKRDLVKELADACKRQGLNFGLYFSLIDWHYPQAASPSSHNADFITPEHHEYNKKQLQELLSNYGTISELWFDMGSLSRQQSTELRALVKKLQPECMVSGRLGNDQGDFSVMGDNQYPDYSIITPWQSPASMYDETWGYRSWQKYIPLEAKVNEKLQSLARTVGRGGNFILNIGPKGDGSVVKYEQNVLLEMGKWVQTNSDAIYQTRPLSLPDMPTYGTMTTRGNKMYFFLLQTPPYNKILLKGISSKIGKLYPLDAPDELLDFTQRGDSVQITLPISFVKKGSVRVITLENMGSISVEAQNVLPFELGLRLTSGNAQRHFSFSGIDYYSSYRSLVKEAWNIRAAATTTVQPTIYYSNEEKGQKITLTIDGKKTPIDFASGVAVNLEKSDLTWGKAAIIGSFAGSIHDINSRINKLDIKEKWGSKNWTVQEDWTLNKTYRQAAKMNEGWFWLQDIVATAPSQILISVPTNDGLAVFLNGQELYLINNPNKDSTLQSTVLLPLVKGNNKLLLKYYNRFGKSVKMGIFTNVPQVMYKKALPEMTLAPKKIYAIDLEQTAPTLIHQNLHVPNCYLELLKKQ